MLTVFHRSSLRPVLMASLLAGLLSLPLVADACQIFYSGRATGIFANVNLLGVSTSLVQADVPISCTGAAGEQVVNTVRSRAPLFIEADNVYAAAQGIDGVATTEAGVEDLSINVAGVKITATAIESQAKAVCNSNGSITLSGTSKLANVTLNGTPISVGTRTNLRIGIPGVATVTFNQQVKSQDIGQIQVFGIRVVLLGATSSVASGEVRVAHTRSRITTCNP